MKLGAEPLKIGPIGVPPRKQEKFTLPGEWYDDEDEREGEEGAGEKEQQKDKDEKKVSCDRRAEGLYSGGKIINPLYSNQTNMFRQLFVLCGSVINIFGLTQCEIRRNMLVL